MWDIVKNVTAFCALLGMTFTAGYTVAGDRIVPASQAYVVAQNTPILQALRGIQLDQETGKKEAAQREADRLELDSIRATDPIEQAKIKQLKRTADETVNKLNSKIQAIESQR